MMAPVQDNSADDDFFDVYGPRAGSFETTAEELPLQFSLQDQTNTHFCSASLIQPLLLLVAAHCVLGKRLEGIKAVSGGDQLGFTNGAGEIRSISKTILHPNYDNVTGDNDIALLVLDRPLPQSIQVNRLANIPNSRLNAAEPATLTGWGLESPYAAVNTAHGALGTYQVNTYNVADCREYYESNMNRTLTDNMFCGGYAGQDSCKETETGALLTCKQEASEGPYICGIGSWGLNCESDPLPVVYTDVSKYHSWIEDNIRILRQN